MYVQIRYGDDIGAIYESNRDYEAACGLFGKENCAILHYESPVGNLDEIIIGVAITGVACCFIVASGCLLDYIGYRAFSGKIIGDVDVIYYHRKDNEARDVYGYFCGMRPYGNADYIEPGNILDAAPPGMMEHHMIWSRQDLKGDWYVVRDVTAFYKNYFKEEIEFKL